MKVIDDMDFCINIKQLRKKLCVTQSEFATILGVTFATVNRWENGHFNPSIKVQRKLIKLYNQIKDFEDK